MTSAILAISMGICLSAICTSMDWSEWPSLTTALAVGFFWGRVGG